MGNALFALMWLGVALLATLGVTVALAALSDLRKLSRRCTVPVIHRPMAALLALRPHSPSTMPNLITHSRKSICLARVSACGHCSLKGSCRTLEATWLVA
jgi:endonuclease III